jgi:hypothetical protein
MVLVHDPLAQLCVPAVHSLTLAHAPDEPVHPALHVHVKLASVLLHVELM